MQKFLILPGCDDTNRGDQALIWETVDLAKKAGYRGKYYMLADNEKSEQSLKKGIGNINYILPHPSTHFSNIDNIEYTKILKLKWAIAALTDLISCVPLLSPGLRKILFPLYSKSKKDTLKLFEESKVSFVKGGGFLHAYGGAVESYKIYYFLYHIRLALSYGHDVFIMPNSFGPFEGIFVKHMINKTLRKCKVIMSRESISQERLKKECGIDSILHSDLAFFLPADEEFNASEVLEKNGIPINEKKCVALTMRPYRFPGSSKGTDLYSEYKNALVEFVVWLSKKDYFPVLVEHVVCDLEHESDISCINDVIKQIDGKCNFGVFSNPKLTCEQMKSVYGCFDFTVGTRFHSVIFSLSENVPSIAIAYGGNKGKGIMKDLKLDDYTVSIDDISSDKLISLFEKLTKNKEIEERKIASFNKLLDNEKKEIVDLIKMKEE